MCSKVAIVAEIGLVTFLHRSSAGTKVSTSLICCHPLPHKVLVSSSALLQFRIQAAACLPIALAEGMKPKCNQVNEVGQGLKPLAPQALAAMESNLAR